VSGLWQHNASGLTAILLVAVLVGGCARKPDPVLVPASGVVTLDGKPLAHALVRFSPTERGISAAWISEGTTDDLGRFELVSPMGPGAVVGTHRVTVSEGGVPDEIRDDQGKVAAWLGKLAGRPLPGRYGTIATSPLEVAVGPSDGTLDLHLAR
jgi:hypothetical protein